MQVDWTRIKSTAIGSLGTLALVAVVFFGLKWHKRVPDVEEEAKGKAAVAILVVDDSAPTIPQGLVLNSPQARSMLLTGKLQVCGITEQWTKDHGYDKLLGKAGGAPALLILDAGGKCLKPGRMPTDVESFDTLVAKYFTSLPPPLAALPDDPVVSSGAPQQVLRDKDGREWIETDGHARMLLAFSNPAKLKFLPSYSSANPIFPADQWYPIDRRNMFPADKFILDQDGIGECVGCGWVNGLRKSRVLCGMADVKLSPGCLYSQINGGQDNGAVISDGIAALCNTGTVSYATIGIKPFYTRQMPANWKAEAARFKMCDAYKVTSWESLVSALLTGRYTVVFGVQVGNNWQRFDANGIAGVDRGPGNHCLHADGLKKIGNQFYLDVPNSWGTSWGPFKNGRVLLGKQHLFNGTDQPDCCVVRTPGRDPKDAYDPPVLKQ